MIMTIIITSRATIIGLPDPGQEGTEEHAADLHPHERVHLLLPGHLSLSLYIYICICIHIYIYI